MKQALWIDFCLASDPLHGSPAKELSAPLCVHTDENILKPTAAKTERKRAPEPNAKGMGEFPGVRTEMLRSPQ